MPGSGRAAGRPGRKGFAGAADPRRGSIRLLQLPLRGGDVEHPCLGILLAPAALVVPAPADDALRDRVVSARRLVPEPGAPRSILTSPAFPPPARRSPAPPPSPPHPGP